MKPNNKTLNRTDVERLSKETGQTWIFSEKESCGCPLDWIGERSIHKLLSNGIQIVPKPGKTIPDLINSGMIVFP